MKKLLLTSLTLFLFSASILMFQMSCSKDANAGNSGGSGTLGQGKFLMIKSESSPAQFAIIDKNGTESIITPNLPAPFNSIDGKYFGTDGNVIFFQAYDDGSSNPSQKYSVFSCDMNGGNVKNLNKNARNSFGEMISVF
jgi:hypothetical protein